MADEKLEQTAAENQAPVGAKAAEEEESAKIAAEKGAKEKSAAAEAKAKAERDKRMSLPCKGTLKAYAGMRLNGGCLVIQIDAKRQIFNVNPKKPVKIAISQ